MTARKATALAAHSNHQQTTLLWDQVAAVQAALSGRAWQLELAPDAPLPSWLIRLTSGHIGHSADVPTPTLFRTAGIGSAWANAPMDVLELYPRHHRQAPDARERILRLWRGIERVHGTTDADVYVHGDGNPDGRFRAEVHAMFGTFERIPAVDELAAFSAGFHVSRPVQDGARTVTLVWTPRFQGRE
ncbi:hypothetical protein [Plantibacter sp. RU18]|uniref:hypothetical protein n=1 Tax=Plantibacter sp. RU18 TaxID=3158143 RepID=UPI003D36B1D2